MKTLITKFIRRNPSKPLNYSNPLLETLSQSLCFPKPHHRTPETSIKAIYVTDDRLPRSELKTAGSSALRAMKNSKTTAINRFPPTTQFRYDDSSNSLPTSSSTQACTHSRTQHSNASFYSYNFCKRRRILDCCSIRE